MRCPICFNEGARLYGPGPLEPGEEGVLFCQICQGVHGSFDITSNDPICWMSEEFDALVQNWTQKHPAPNPLQDVLPKQIKLELDDAEVVELTFQALFRYDELTAANLNKTVREIVYWWKGGRPVDGPSERVLRLVRERQGSHNARCLILTALQRVTLRLGRSWAYLHELNEEDGELLFEAARWLDWDATTPRSQGHLLAKVALKTGEDGPGFRKLLQRGRDGVRWELVGEPMKWGRQ